VVYKAEFETLVVGFYEADQAVEAAEAANKKGHEEQKVLAKSIPAVFSDFTAMAAWRKKFNEKTVAVAILEDDLRTARATRKGLRGELEEVLLPGYAERVGKYIARRQLSKGYTLAEVVVAK